MSRFLTFMYDKFQIEETNFYNSKEELKDVLFKMYESELWNLEKEDQIDKNISLVDLILSINKTYDDSDNRFEILLIEENNETLCLTGIPEGNLKMLQELQEDKKPDRFLTIMYDKNKVEYTKFYNSTEKFKNDLFKMYKDELCESNINTNISLVDLILFLDEVYNDENSDTRYSDNLFEIIIITENNESFSLRETSRSDLIKLKELQEFIKKIK